AVDELEYFDRIKRTLNNKYMFAEFLKCLNLFSHEIITKYAAAVPCPLLRSAHVAHGRSAHRSCVGTHRLLQARAGPAGARLYRALPGPVRLVQAVCWLQGPAVR